MTQLKFESKVAAAASNALEPYVRKLYARRGMSLMFIGEMKTTERTEPEAGEDKDAVVKVRITSLEIPNDDQEPTVRDAQRALYLQRSATGTLDDDSGQLELSENTLRLAGGMLHAVEVARVRVALRYWADYARRVQNGPDLTAGALMKEMEQIAAGLTAALAGADADDAV